VAQLFSKKLGPGVPPDSASFVGLAVCILEDALFRSLMNTRHGKKSIGLNRLKGMEIREKSPVNLTLVEDKLNRN
jgi:hypothetical protein